ncbi:MAG TPA: hypothetical protein VM509_04190 [Planctomycetota bacterium]|nr:hypothetical protein [Planctomycetota bacterium]
MHLHATLASFALLLLSSSLPFARESAPQEDVRARFEALDDQHDEAALVQLWKDHPGETLGTIDSYLEGSLKKLERDPKVAPAELAAMRARAVRGAKAADIAFGTAIFSDYAAAFASWKPEEQKRFRAGQSLFREALQALKKNDARACVDKARASLELALPLGDWWGSAMAWNAMARGEAASNEPAKALEHALQARLVDHDLRLLDSEADDLALAAAAASALDAHGRALSLARAGATLAHELADRDAETKFLEQVLRAQEKLGDAEGMAKTREEIGRVPKPEKK